MSLAIRPFSKKFDRSDHETHCRKFNFQVDQQMVVLIHDYRTNVCQGYFDRIARILALGSPLRVLL